MAFSKFRPIFLGVAFLVSACSFTEETLWPSLTGEDPAGADQQAQAPAPAPAPQQAAQPPLGTTDFQPDGVTPGSPTGTFVGKKVVELREELTRLQEAVGAHNGQLQNLRTRIVEDSQRYHGTTAAINARLQVGTTPGNPILVQQFNAAQADLDRLGGDITEMNNLATAVASDSTMSSFLSESARAAFNISGAVDEDHRQLAILEDEVNRTVVLIDRLLKEVTDDVRRQTNYVATERSNLNLLSAGIKTGEIYGASLTNRALASAGSRAGQVGALGATAQRPLVVIRFDRANVPYQQALYNAVSKVLERRPDAVFDLVAVAPSAGGPAKVALNANKARRSAEGVLRSLIEMGLPPTRVAVSARTSAQARTNEVHLYLR
ncbi:MAG: hypothetical protein H6907_10695 [Hyphomicrobiales bacterium]|nr:hypothetical protein [Hyphomicrobiales bacterium]MCP5372187.1 hypothetical protein [Hyphomicrobiales bacterium]